LLGTHLFCGRVRGGTHMTEKERKIVRCRKARIFPVTDLYRSTNPPVPLGTLQLVRLDEDHVYVCFKNHEGDCAFAKEDEP